MVLLRANRVGTRTHRGSSLPMAGPGTNRVTQRIWQRAGWPAVTRAQDCRQRLTREMAREAMASHALLKLPTSVP